MTMYYLKTEHSFDSAHFLAGYNGKCRNIHGHEWRVVIEICRPDLDAEGQTRDMMFDFGQLKKDVKRELEEKFRIIELPYRPTAERLAHYFYEKLTSCGYQVHRATVYETPNNCASYEE